MNFRVASIVAALAVVHTAFVHADVRVLVGPTPILFGDARSRADITVVNERLAFALAVQSAVPYGVPRAAIVDVAPVTDGKIGRDRVVFADFIPDNWSAWPDTHQQIDVLERGPEKAVIRSIRAWGKASVTTRYTLRRNADFVEIRTILTNHGSVALTNLLSGLTLWPNSGYLFGVPGITVGKEGTADGALTDRVVAYDETWAVTLHAPYFDHIGYGSKDMFRLHTLAPGQSRSFDAQLQVGASGDLAPVVQAEIRRKRLNSGVVHGFVGSTDGRAVDQPVVMIQKQGHAFAWTLGHAGSYEIRLPVGEYSLYATAKAYSQSKPISLVVAADSKQSRDFRDLEHPGHALFFVSNAADAKPLDARIIIKEGQKPLVEFLGKKTFFTELTHKGAADIEIAPGAYVFTVSSGGGFLSFSQDVALEIPPGGTAPANVPLNVPFDPTTQRWFSADLHHHADQAEAVTPPSDLARSQLAAGLDLLFVSDHDSTANLDALEKIAGRRGLPFLPGIEISPSWGHFNAYPVSPGAKLAIDTGKADIAAVLAEARRLGAIDVQVNHPFIPFGYLTSVAAGVAPGGFDPAFDLLEINAAEKGDEQVLSALADFWNSGHRYYLTAGTDTHDVWKDESGRVRTFVHVDGPVSASAFAQSLKDGHAYVSYGPLIFPSILFGDTLKVKPDQSFVLRFDLKSIAGLASIEVIGGGKRVSTKTFEGSRHEAHVEFSLQTHESTWYALRVADRLGKKAYTNPIWIDVVRF